jgi:hypothetical protein
MWVISPTIDLVLVILIRPPETSSGEATVWLHISCIHGASANFQQNKLLLQKINYNSSLYLTAMRLNHLHINIQCGTPYPASQNPGPKIRIFFQWFLWRHFPMVVMFKTGALRYFDSPPSASGATVDGLLTTILTNTNEGSWHRERKIYFFRMPSALRLKSPTLQSWLAYEGMWQQMHRSVQKSSTVVRVGRYAACLFALV